MEIGGGDGWRHTLKLLYANKMCPLASFRAVLCQYNAMSCVSMVMNSGVEANVVLVRQWSQSPTAPHIRSVPVLIPFVARGCQMAVTLRPPFDGIPIVQSYFYNWRFQLQQICKRPSNICQRAEQVQKAFSSNISFGNI